MKHILFLALLISSANVFASSLVNIKTLTNPALQKAYFLIDSVEVISHSSVKKIVAQTGSRADTVTLAMHSLCDSFNDGVSLKLNSKDTAGATKAVNEFTADLHMAGSNDYYTILEALKNANLDSTSEIYSGTASGKNTTGTVLGIYDTKNNELVVFASTNCGSDY
jgi:hypothetical protein